MKKQKINHKRYNDLKSDFDPILEKKLASKEARLNSKRDILKQVNQDWK